MPDKEVTPDTPLGDLEVILSQASVEKNAQILKETPNKGKKGPTQGKEADNANQVILYAGGYPGYKRDDVEIAFIEMNNSYPNTIDFKQTAKDTQKDHLHPVKDVKSFFEAFKKEQGMIRRIVIIGHGSPMGIGLSGGTGGPSSQRLSKTDLENPKWIKFINENIKPKLQSNTYIDIYACSTAIGNDFLKPLARAFGVKVRGFDEDIAWCITYNNSKDKITSRGRIAPKSKRPKSKSCNDKGWHKGVNKFFPPMEVTPN